ncbi:MAG: TRAP transporter substrate-binding protein [Deltaproteobacteria bacterium]
MRGRKSVLLFSRVYLVLLMAVFFLIAPSTKSYSEQTNPGKTIKLSMSSFLPAEMFVNKRILSQWIADVATVTHGRVKIDLYPGGTLTGVSDTYQGILKGVTDIGLGVVAYQLQKFPLIEMFELPGLSYPDPVVSTMTTWEGYKKFKDLVFTDTKILFLMTTGPGFLGTVKKPVYTLEDLKGLEINATGSTAEAAKALGAVPVNIPAPEIYLALQKGILKGQICPPEFFKSFRTGELVHYVTVPTSALYNKVWFVAMNLKKWNSLEPDIQRAIGNASDENWIEKASRIFDSYGKGGLDFVKENGGEIIYLSPEENARWAEMLKAVPQKYIRDLDAKGLPGQAVWDTAVQLSKKYTELYK